MKRPALATALLISAALATAGCSGGQAASGSGAPAASSAAGAQSYASMVDLYTAVLGTGTTCAGLTMEPSTTARSEAGCDLAGGGRLVLQSWRDGADRDAGVSAAKTALAARQAPYCVLEGVGTTGLWSVEASGNAKVCSDIAHRLGGRLTTSAVSKP